MKIIQSLSQNIEHRDPSKVRAEEIKWRTDDALTASDHRPTLALSPRKYGGILVDHLLISHQPDLIKASNASTPTE